MNAMLILVIALSCGAAALLEAKCLRDPCIPDNPLSLAGRRIKIVGYAIIGMRFLYLLVDGQDVFIPSAIGLLMVAFSDCIRCANRLQMPRSIMGGMTQ